MCVSVCVCVRERECVYVVYMCVCVCVCVLVLKASIYSSSFQGRRFKRFMLFLHLTVTTIITIIMVIIIAVCWLVSMPAFNTWPSYWQCHWSAQHSDLLWSGDKSQHLTFFCCLIGTVQVKSELSAFSWFSLGPHNTRDLLNSSPNGQGNIWHNSLQADLLVHWHLSCFFAAWVTHLIKPCFVWPS